MAHDGRNDLIQPNSTEIRMSHHPSVCSAVGEVPEKHNGVPNQSHLLIFRKLTACRQTGVEIHIVHSAQLDALLAANQPPNHRQVQLLGFVRNSEIHWRNNRV